MLQTSEVAQGSLTCLSGTAQGCEETLAWVPSDRTAPAAQQSGLRESQHKGLRDFWHQPSHKHNFFFLDSKLQTLAYKVICKVRQIYQQRAEAILMFYISHIFYFSLQLKYNWCQRSRVLTVNRKDSEATCFLKGCFLLM